MMTAIEGQILSLSLTDNAGCRGIEIRVFIPEPPRPGIIDQVFYDTEKEFEAANDRNEKDRKKYAVDLENMYSLCLEDIGIYPHRELKRVA
jgi:hypothetical protein